MYNILTSPVSDCINKDGSQLYILYIFMQSNISEEIDNGNWIFNGNNAYDQSTIVTTQYKQTII
jgi:hypothetical protein